MEENTPVFHSLSSNQSVVSVPLALLFLVIIASGITSGYFIVSYMSKQKTAATTSVGAASIQKGAVYGSDDTKTFKDTAEGVVAAGGVNGEGQYHLVRPGGDSQNVYMTSSLVDLSLFLKRKVKVWGQTQKAQTAGWLMDVGRVEVIE